MIEVTGLQKSFAGTKAVRDVSFTAARGEILGFLGPNGAGKTTTLRILSTYLKPSAGSARIAGFDIVQDGFEVRKKIGYLPEVPPLYADMTVSEYLRFVAGIKGVAGASVSTAVSEAIERCSLQGFEKKLCGHLSRGYRQRVGVAQAIVHNPEVIILDEPTSGLDPRQIMHIRELISSLGADRTVILSTHILPEVTMLCSKVVIINQGSVAIEKNLEELLKSSSLEEVFLNCVNSEETQPEETNGGSCNV